MSITFLAGALIIECMASPMWLAALVEVSGRLVLSTGR
jgi:hypothetical protein